MMKLIKIAPHTIAFLPDPKEIAIDAQRIEEFWTGHEDKE